MPASRKVARFSKRFLNRLCFGIISHVGRNSGRAYRVPVNVFRIEGGYIVALTLGPESDWVKNVLAAGSCELQTRGQRLRLSDPRIETDEANSWVPVPVRFVLNRIDAPEYMRLFGKISSSKRTGLRAGRGEDLGKDPGRGRCGPRVERDGTHPRPQASGSWNRSLEPTTGR